MANLWCVTALWAFSFSLIGVYLSGAVDAYFAVAARIALAAAVFAPFLRPRALALRLVARLMAIGALQIGLMYIFFYQSFRWLSVPEVLLFTIFTPVYISLIDDLIGKRLRWRYLLVAGAAVAGAAVIRYHGVAGSVWTGFALVQGANLCFAAGQVGYRRLAPALPAGVPAVQIFGWFFIGALPLATLAFAAAGDWRALPTTAVQWLVLLWLGVGASGAGYFAWNQGAARVDAGTLAVMNNLLIPAGLLVNVVIWNHDADLARLAAGAAIMLAALAANARWARQADAPRSA